VVKREQRRAVLGTAKEDAIGMRVLSTGDGVSIADTAVPLNIVGDGLFVLVGRRPNRWDREGVQASVVRIAGSRTLEALRVPVEVDVFFVRATPPRKAVGIDRVDQQQRDASLRGASKQCFVVQHRQLTGGATKSLHPMRARRDDQQAARLRRRDQGYVGRQLFVE
jgi:hypothetical protein